MFLVIIIKCLFTPLEERNQETAPNVLAVHCPVTDQLTCLLNKSLMLIVSFSLPVSCKSMKVSSRF
jgi:hypothetical protein